MNHSGPGPEILLVTLGMLAFFCILTWFVVDTVESFRDFRARLDFWWPPAAPHDLPRPPQPPPAALPEPVVFRRRLPDVTVPPAAHRDRRPPSFRRGERRPATFCRICGQPFGGVPHDDCNAG